MSDKVTITDGPTLNAPTPASEIKTRQGPGGRMLSYIDARFVMERLDEVVGPSRWQDKYEDRADGSVRCGIGIFDPSVQQWVWKWDVGDPSDIEATKGVHSDAFKRAGVKWGIGRDLYGDHTPANPSRPAAEPPPAVAPGRSEKPVAPRQAQTTRDDEPYPWDGIDTVPMAQEAFAGLVDEAKCPTHDKPWRTNSRGFYCASKLPDGKWCAQTPSKAWQASQELQPA